MPTTQNQGISQKRRYLGKFGVTPEGKATCGQWQYERQFVYFIRDPETKAVRYIGSSHDPQKRLIAHRWDNTGPCRDWLSGLKRRGLRPILDVIFGPLSILQAYPVEQRLIALHRLAYPGQILNRERHKAFIFPQDLTILENLSKRPCSQYRYRYNQDITGRTRTKGQTMLYENSNLRDLEQRHAELKRLGWYPHSIFQTSRGTWAFWVR
jgi:hypothetical protein